MDLLFQHQQSKTFKSNDSHSECNIRLYEYNNLVHYIAEFGFDFHRSSKKHKLVVNHGFTLNLKNGDIDCYYQLSTETPTGVKNNRGKTKRSKNNFGNIFDLVENGFYKGEKRNGYWGIRYEKSLNKMMDILIDKLQPLIENEHYKKINYTENFKTKPLFDLLVDFHLDRKKIKGHDSVYHTIISEYPKHKWLKNNEHKFLPAVLDSYNIKSKYLIGEINKNSSQNINIKTLNYLCKLFGENHVDYLRQFDWVSWCLFNTPNKKTHTLKNEYEKNNMVNLIKNWQTNTDTTSSLIDVINETLTTRDFVESKGIELKFNAKTSERFEILFEEWDNLKTHFKRGYRVRYTYPDYFLYEIESDIKIKDKIFEVKILKTEEDFKIEGYLMKNCMGKEFKHGIVSTYITMKHNRTRINLQYKNGLLLQAYGKANSQIDDTFTDAIKVLNGRMSDNQKVTWFKEKFDFIR